MTSVIFAFLHHLAVLMLFACLFYEHLAVKPNIDKEAAKRLIRIDLIYGISAAVLLTAGIFRVFMFEKTSDFYLYNWIFYIKMGLILLLALLSIYPTVVFLRWREQIRQDLEPTLTKHQASMIAMLIRAELLLVSLVLAPAVLIAKNYGFFGE